MPFEMLAEEFGRPRVLLVEDDDDLRFAYELALKSAGWAVAGVSTGAQALVAAHRDIPDVVVLDLGLPDRDGRDVLAELKSVGDTDWIPVVVLSARAAEAEVGALLRSGAQDYLVKPCSIDELDARLTAALRVTVQHRRLIRTEARYRQVVELADEGIWATDADQKILFANRRIGELLGVPAGEMIGGTISRFLDDEGLAAAKARIDRRKAGLTETSDFKFVRADGTELWTSINAAPIVGEDGSFEGSVALISDISARRAHDAALTLMADAATEASQLKSDFLANMSHEIRTPMNGVIGMIDLLLETPLTTVQRDFAQTVRDSGEALLTILNDILDFSKIEAGKLEVEMIEFSVRTLVDAVVDLLASAAQTKGVALIADIGNSTPRVVRGDPGRIRQVLTNLIGNALKFTHSGEVVLRINQAEDAGADVFLRFEVSDTGDGIAPDKLALVFQPFVQVDTSTARKYGGTGLGLAICAQLVEAMGGETGVASELGAGSQFWFTIPAHADDPSLVDLIVMPDAVLSGVRALVMESSATLSGVLVNYLSAWGMQVASADSAPAALALLRAAAADGTPFLVAVIDASMSASEGSGLVETMSHDPSLNTRVVLMTGLGGQPEPAGPAPIGVSASLSKPIHASELRAHLRDAIGMPTGGGPRPEVDEHRSPAENLPRGRLLLAEDNAVNQKVAVTILSQAGYRVDVVPNGAMAVRAAAAERYEVILMDCQMPELNGYEATSAIRADEGPGRRTPIIAMTAGARDEDRERCLREGMDGYISKPFNKDKLLAVVSSFQYAGLADLTVDERRARAEELTLDPTRLDRHRQRGSETGLDLLGGIIEDFVRRAEPLLVKLREAVKAGDSAAVDQAAHSIHRRCSKLGAQRLALSCGRLEATAALSGMPNVYADLEAIELDYRLLRGSLTRESSR